MASQDITTVAAYRCPGCRAALAAHAGPDRPWLRCPRCGRAGRPPDPERPARASKPHRPKVADEEVGPGPAWEPAEMQRFSVRRIILALGVFVGGGMVYDAALPATFRPEPNVGEAVVGAVMAAVSFGLLAIQARGRRPSRR